MISIFKHFASYSTAWSSREPKYIFWASSGRFAVKLFFPLQSPLINRLTSIGGHLSLCWPLACFLPPSLRFLPLTLVHWILWSVRQLLHWMLLRSMHLRLSLTSQVQHTAIPVIRSTGVAEVNSYWWLPVPFSPCSAAANCEANSDFVPVASGGDGSSVQFCEFNKCSHWPSTEMLLRVCRAFTIAENYHSWTPRNWYYQNVSFQDTHNLIDCWIRSLVRPSSLTANFSSKNSIVPCSLVFHHP